MKVVLKQIRNDKVLKDLEKEGHVFLYGFVAAGLILVLAIYTPFPGLVSIAFGFASLLILRPLVRRLYGDYAKEDDFVGDVVFDEDRISWQESDLLRFVLIREVNSIELHHNFVQGKFFMRRDIIHNGLAEIKIVGLDQSAQTFKFVIQDSNQMEALKILWKQYYRSGINVKEFMGNDRIRSVLFGPIPLGIDKRQALKDDLRIDRFYN